MELFKNEEEADNFSIYDSILERYLPLYYKYYVEDNKKYEELKNELKKIDKNKIFYKKYMEYIDEIINKVEKKYGDRISRNGLDQLIWYYHK